MTIGERIKEVRVKLSMSQVAFADKIGVSKQTLYKYENNIITNIPSDKIEAVAVLGKVSPAYLMGWEEHDFYAELDIFEEMLSLLGWEYQILSECDGLAINEYLDDEDKIYCDENNSVEACYACKCYQPYYYLTNNEKYYKLSKLEFDGLSSCLKPYLEFRINELISKKKGLTELEFKTIEGLIPRTDAESFMFNTAHADDYANDPEELESLEETISVKTNIIKFTDVKDAKKFLEGQKISAFITSEMTDNSILEIANVLYNNSKNKK